MKKYIFKTINMALLLVMMISAFKPVYADFWTDANSWYKGDAFDSGIDETKVGDATNSLLPQQAKDIIEEFSGMVNVVGTTVIVLVTIFLGIKYMFGSFEAKADVKESLINLVVACVFFFGWNSIWNILFTDGQLAFAPLNSTSYETVVGKVFSTLTSIANLLAVGAVIYIGIRYIFSGAQGKSDLKAKSGQFIIGIILAFCSVGFLNYINSIVKSIFS